MSTASPSPSTAVVPAEGSAALRVVLFGMPDAGKSSLLGALLQATQAQERILQGRLTDKTSGLMELWQRVYVSQQRETREEIVPYPIVFEPYAGMAEGNPRLEIVLYDCDGRVANDLLAHRKSLATDARVGSLARAVLDADALVLTVDASANDEQVETDFREFVRFLRLLEGQRSHNRAVGGLPVYLTLTKCDLLARQPMPRTTWEAKIDERQKQVQERFSRYLESNADTAGALLSFGSLDLHVFTTAVKRPALTETAAQPREPFGVAELFHDCLMAAHDFRVRTRAADRRLKWMLGSVGGFIAIAALVAFFLLGTGGPVDKPTALSAKVEQLQARDKPAPERLAHDVLQRRYRELTEIRNDPTFEGLPNDKKLFVKGRIDELIAYQDFRERLYNIPASDRVKSGDALEDIKKKLESQAWIPAAYAKEWEKTPAVLERERRSQQRQAIFDDVERLRTFFASLKTSAEARLFETKLNATWAEKVEAIFREEKMPPIPREVDPKIDIYDFTEIKKAEKEWLATRRDLETLRTMATAVGLLGEPGEALLLIPAVSPQTDLNAFAAERLEKLAKQYPDYRKWTLSSQPEDAQKEIRLRLQESFDHLVHDGQRMIHARYRVGKPTGEDSPRDWNDIALWLMTPGLQEWRNLLAYFAKQLTPEAPDPVSELVTFLGKKSFEFEVKTLYLHIPSNLPQGNLTPADTMLIHLRPQGATAVRQTFTLHIKRSATDDRPQGKTYRYDLEKGEGKLSYKIWDECGAELVLKNDNDKAWQLTWSNARTATFAFESLVRVPSINTLGATDPGKIAEGVILRFEGAPFPPVPELLPDVRRKP